jgi:hypothetical protein
MTALDELQTFAKILDPFCQAAGVKFACLKAEHELLFCVQLLAEPWLCLSQVSEELACGHIIRTAEGRNLFIRVRTPFAATETLKFISLRTYSLVSIRHRTDLPEPWFERALDPGAADEDLWHLLFQATDALLQAPLPDQAFLQLEQSAPVLAKERTPVSYRATFCSGTVVGTVLPISTAANSVASANHTQVFLL